MSENNTITFSMRVSELGFTKRMKEVRHCKLQDRIYTGMEQSKNTAVE